MNPTNEAGRSVGADAARENDNSQQTIEPRIAVSNYLRLLLGESPGVFEIRQHKPFVRCGYFDNIDLGVDAVMQAEREYAHAIYVTPNPLFDSTRSRITNAMAPGKTGGSVSKTDIAKRRWLIFDIDVGPNAERGSALKFARDLRAHFAARGWSEPLIGMSGRGAYLLYRIDLPNDERSTYLIRHALHAANHAVERPEGVHVDGGVADACRVIKVLGSMVRKSGFEPVRSWCEAPAGELAPIAADKLAGFVIDIFRYIAGWKVSFDPATGFQLHTGSESGRLYAITFHGRKLFRAVQQHNRIAGGVYALPMHTMSGDAVLFRSHCTTPTTIAGDLPFVVEVPVADDHPIKYRGQEHATFQRPDGSSAVRLHVATVHGEGGRLPMPAPPPDAFPSEFAFGLHEGFRQGNVPELEPQHCDELLQVFVGDDEPLYAALVEASASVLRDAKGDRPGDDFNIRGTFEELGLIDAGWAIIEESDGVKRLTKPDGTPGALHATYGAPECRDDAGNDRLHVFSTESDIPRGTHYKFGVYAMLNHDGDYAAAAKALKEQGYGIGTPTATDTATATEQSKRETAKSAVGQAEIVPFSQIETRPIIWLWNRRFALGTLSMIAGNPGLGKSFLTLDIASRVSTGREWPDGAPGSQGDVLLIGAEDDESTTIKPRLVAACADLDRVHNFGLIKTANGHRAFTLKDVAVLENAIARYPNTRLVIIDPISAYMEKTDSHSNAEVRGLLGPLSKLANRKRVALLVVSHLNKNSGGSSAVSRVNGSLAFIAAARSGWLVCEDRDDRKRRMFLCVKSNVGQEPSGLAYRIVGTGVGDNAVIQWDKEPVETTADEALSLLSFSRRRGKDGGSAAETAKRFLQETLKDGPVAEPVVDKAAESLGISKATLRRAKDELKIESKRSGFGRGAVWQWTLPGDARKSPTDGAQGLGEQGAGDPPATRN